MRRILLALTTIIALLGIYGCEEATTSLDTPSVTYEAIENGAKLRLTWAAITDAEGYYIYVEGVNGDTTIDVTATSCDVTGPAESIEVSAYKGRDESDKWSLDLTAEVTSSITVYGTSGTGNSGFGFSSDGTAITYPLWGADTATNWPKVDFIVEDSISTTTIEIWSPEHGSYFHGAFNSKSDASVATAGTDFDALDIAAAPGNYLTQTSLVDNGLYSIWLDPNANDWDATSDHFGKLKVLSISGSTVNMKLAYQKVSGLRWVVTD